MTEAETTRNADDGDEERLRRGLQEFLRAEYGSHVTVSGFARLAGGASCDVFGFEAALEMGEVPRALVVRVDAGGRAVGSDRYREFELYKAAEAGGVRVPHALCYGAEDAGLGRAFFVMERVGGEAIPRHLLRDPAYEHTRRVLPEQLAVQLARTHAVDLTHAGVAPLVREADALGASGGLSQARAVVACWTAVLDDVGAGHPWPALAWTARWLDRHAPADSGRTLVHGDFRVGNALFDTEGLTAVLDWELAHVDDPIEDLGWFCVRSWRFGADDKEAGGLCSRDEFASAYERSGGCRVEADRLRYWEVFGNWKWAIISIGQERAHKAGSYPNVELASIGRRVGEIEQEMLNLMERF